MKVVAIPGSLRSTSSSYNLLKIVSTLFPADVEFEIYQDIGKLPHLDDREMSYPEVDAFRKVLADADAILICTPESAFGVPGTLKNALDWTVSSGEFVEKPVALITASSSGEHAHSAMKLILTAINSKRSDEAMLLIPLIRSKFDKDGTLKDPALLEALRRVVNALVAL